MELRHGECLAHLRCLPEESVDCVITDPPYGVGFSYDGVYVDQWEPESYFRWQLEVVKECGRVLKKSGNFFYLNYPEFCSRIFYPACEAGVLFPYEQIFWTTNVHLSGNPLRKATRTWNWWVKGKRPAFLGDDARRGEYKNPEDKRIAARMAQGLRPVDYDWWFYNIVKNTSSEKTSHPCQVPLVMVERLVRLGCPEGGTVLEPFLGSGTTAEACLNTGRDCLGIELSPQYYQIALDRLEKARQRQVSLF